MVFNDCEPDLYDGTKTEAQIKAGRWLRSARNYAVNVDFFATLVDFVLGYLASFNERHPLFKNKPHSTNRFSQEFKNLMRSYIEENRGKDIADRAEFNP